jgi:hypothetical protein
MKIFSQPKKYWSKEACKERYKCETINEGDCEETKDVIFVPDNAEADEREREYEEEAQFYAEQAENDAQYVWENSRGTSNLK